jgi:hypothetical protein
MATRHETRDHTREDERLGAYDTPRPMPDEALLGTAPAPTRSPYGPASARDEAMSASGLNVIAGIWLIISPFVLGYGGGDAYWNPIVFGAIVAVVALARLGGAYRATWLASTARASWNEWILGVVVFVLGAWSAAASEDARTARVR